MSLIDRTATELLADLQAGAVSSVEVTQAYLDRIAEFDSKVRAFVEPANADRALAQAAAIDEKRAKRQPLGVLAGLPVAIKDLLCTQGERTTCASRMLQNFVPPYDATVIAKLRAADAVFVGKTNLDEFAMGGSTEHSAFGATRNPWNPQCTPGGSSGGAAAAVAASMAPLSIGTDTGGSIRQPAALCGVTGLKPTYGRVSRRGLVAFASSLDQIGPLAWTVEDAALLLGVIAGHDPGDSTSVDHPVPDYLSKLQEEPQKLRLGVVREQFEFDLDPDVQRAFDAAVAEYRQAGAEIVDISLPHSKYTTATYYIIAPCEASSNLARYDGAHYGHRCDERALLEELAREEKELIAAGKRDEAEKLDPPLIRMYKKSRSEGFGPEVKRRIMLGTYALSSGYYDAYYLRALKVRRRIREDYDHAFGKVDLVLGPVTAAPAFKLGDKLGDPLAMYLVDLFTVGANLAGIPGISIPCGFSTSGLPIGLHLQAPPFGEVRLLQAAHQFQQMTDWHMQRPNLTETCADVS